MTEPTNYKRPQNRRVLVSGASIAGPSLAFWLSKYGFEVTVVETTPEMRRGGQAVDFKGATHRTVLERMGILEAVHKARWVGGGDGFIVDASGRKVATVPAAFSGGEVEILRGDLAQILFERTVATCEYVFGDSVASLKETTDGVEVTFERSAPRVFDLVVGADGIHSNVRKLAFGPEADYVRYLGYYYALAKIGGEASEDVMYNEPGRMASIGGPKAPAFFVFASEPLQYERDNIDQQKRLLADAYAGGAWKIPELIEKLPAAEEFYMDSVSRVIADHYSKGRVVLLGDSAYGNTLGGFGTGLAIVGAYVLAGELYRSNGDYKVAYAQYESKFRGYAKVSQKVNSGKLLAPSTRLGLYARNRMFSVAALFQGVMKLMDHFATDIKLDDYANFSSPRMS